jgi:hypothetical protein
VEQKLITLSYEPGKAGGPWFMSTKLSEHPKGKAEYGVLQFVKGQPGEMIFKIATKNIKFRDDDPIVITATSKDGDITQFGKPPGGGDAIKVGNGNKDLVPTNYEYDLHFDNGTSLDPIIQNGCCRMSMVSDSGAIHALLVAAVLIILGAARLRWARP